MVRGCIRLVHLAMLALVDLSNNSRRTPKPTMGISYPETIFMVERRLCWAMVVVIGSGKDREGWMKRGSDQPRDGGVFIILQLSKVSGVDSRGAGRSTWGHLVALLVGW